MVKNGKNDNFVKPQMVVWGPQQSASVSNYRYDSLSQHNCFQTSKYPSA